MSAFSYFDKDASGYITLDEIQQACMDFGLDDIHIDEMIKEIDQDNVSNVFNLTFMHRRSKKKLHGHLIICCHLI